MTKLDRQDLMILGPCALATQASGLVALLILAAVLTNTTPADLAGVVAGLVARILA